MNQARPSLGLPVAAQCQLLLCPIELYDYAIVEATAMSRRALGLYSCRLHHLCVVFVSTFCEHSNAHSSPT